MCLYLDPCEVGPSALNRDKMCCVSSPFNRSYRDQNISARVLVVDHIIFSTAAGWLVIEACQ
jgi:hypothetical protein